MPVCHLKLHLKLREGQVSMWNASPQHLKQLSEKVSGYVLSRTIYELNRASCNQVADKMPLNINMFCSGMKLPMTMSKLNGGLTVWIKSNGVFKWLKDFAKKVLEPNQFLGSMHCSNGFIFSSWQGYKLLFALNTKKWLSCWSEWHIQKWPAYVLAWLHRCPYTQTTSLGDKHATTLEVFSWIFHNLIQFDIHILSDRNQMTPMHSHNVTGFCHVYWSIPNNSGCIAL